MRYHAIPLISGKHYQKNIVEFDYIEANVFKNIFEKTNAKIIGSVRLKETNDNTDDVLIIQSNGQQFQYKVEHDNVTQIMGYILVAPDTYIAVKKELSSWFTAICVPVICCIAICCIAVYVLWILLSGATITPITHIEEPQGIIMGETETFQGATSSAFSSCIYITKQQKYII